MQIACQDKYTTFFSAGFKQDPESPNVIIQNTIFRIQSKITVQKVQQGSSSDLVRD